jgi:hypothetical protein
MNRWPILAATLFLIAAAVWVHSHPRRVAPVSGLVAKLAAQRQEMIEQRRAEKAARRLVKARNKLVDAEPLATTAASGAAQTPPRPDLLHSTPSTATPGAAADPSGLYRGQVCYGARGAEPAHYYEAKGVVLQDRISGVWPGRIPGVTVYMGG